MSATDEFIQEYFTPLGFNGAVIALRDKTGLPTQVVMQVVRDLIIRNAHASKEFLTRAIQDGFVRDVGEVHLCGRLCLLFATKSEPGVSTWHHTTKQLVAGRRYTLRLNAKYKGEVAPSLVLYHNKQELARTKAEVCTTDEFTSHGFCLAQTSFTATGGDRFELYNRSYRSSEGVTIEPMIAIPEQ